MPAASIEQQLRSAIENHKRGDLAEAEAAYRAILALQTDQPIAQHFLGMSFYQRGEVELALPLLRSSVARLPHEPDFQNNLGLALSAANNLAEAIVCFRQAIALKPANEIAYNNIGLALQAKLEVPEAIQSFREAIRLAPAYADAHWNLSLALLLDGDFEQGWEGYEWRRRIAQLGPIVNLPGPEWDGRITSSFRLLVYCEQGLGDAIQFSRYLPWPAQNGIRVFLRAAPELYRLFLNLGDGVRISTDAEPLPTYDAHIPLLSLARLYRAGQEAIPAKVPYLQPAPQDVARWRSRFDCTPPSKRIGLAWAGSRTHRNDRNRSATLGAWAALGGVPGVTYFSLQHGEAANQQQEWEGPAKLVDWTSDCTDFEDTAALVSGLDLVITVDTSVAHLAGAMAKPVWILLPYAPDWRWQLHRNDSPWYPTARLFRQRSPGRWDDVIEEVSAALTAYEDKPSSED